MGGFIVKKMKKMGCVLLAVIVSLFALISCGNGTVPDVSKPMIRLLSPLDGATDLDTTLTLTWDATPSGVLSLGRERAIGTISGYLVYCAPAGSDYPAGASNSTTVFCIDKQLTKMDLAEGVTYRWRVEVLEESGKRQSSQEYRFTTKTGPVLPWFEETLSEPAVYTMEGAIWVSSVGDDLSGSGSEAHPYRTIAKALSQCAGGERIENNRTIVLCSGIYREAVRIRWPNVTLRSAPGHWAIVQVPTDDEEIGVAVTMDVDPSGSKIQSLEIIGGYYYGIKFETRWDWGTEDRSGASDIVIEDCVIHDTGRDAVKITPQCDRITIRRCEIYASGVGIGNQGNPNAEGIDNVNGDRMKVQECYIHDVSTTGIYFKGGAQECVVERNIIENCGGSGILIGFDTSPEYFDLTVNPEYYESRSGIVRNNLIVDTAYAGIGLYAAKDAQVYHNTIVRTAREGMSPITFGITFQDWEPEAGRPPGLAGAASTRSATSFCRRTARTPPNALRPPPPRRKRSAGFTFWRWRAWSPPLAAKRPWRWPGNLRRGRRPPPCSSSRTDGPTRTSWGSRRAGGWARSPTCLPRTWARTPLASPAGANRSAWRSWTAWRAFRWSWRRPSVPPFSWRRPTPKALSKPIAN